MENGKSHDHGVQPNIVNNNMFDDLLKFDNYIRSVLPSVRLSLPSTPTNIAATIVVTDSMLLNESTTTKCYYKSEKVALGHARSFSLDSFFLVGDNDGKEFSGKDAEEGNMKHHFLKRNSVPEKLDEMGDAWILANGKSADKSNERENYWCK
ncbi:hypothetical protein TanjilG_11568 [Lupinus angustifolius]|uniref:Uncharacterized protein n=1 Tax=Lupinus angustifolius TaxID=3871 RepID=A0A1J7G9M7_LUPAN|nr:hypothetical protein TanjilG_11568 [Lupinus angustifolius]